MRKIAFDRINNMKYKRVEKEYFNPPITRIMINPKISAKNISNQNLNNEEYTRFIRFTP
jgi:hypothetical protein